MEIVAVSEGAGVSGSATAQREIPNIGPLTYREALTMWNLVTLAFLLFLAFLFILIFWSVGGVGAAYLVAFVGTLAVAVASSIRQALRRP